MKTLYESLLDIDIQANQGIEKELKRVLKSIGTVGNYEGGYSIPNGRSNRIFVPHILQGLGFDANCIHIFMYTMSNSSEDWVLEITLSKRSDDDMKHICNVLCSRVYMDRWAFNKWNDVVKYLLKPASKSLDTLKRFLNNIGKLDGHSVDKILLLK